MGKASRLKRQRRQDRARQQRALADGTVALPATYDPAASPWENYLTTADAGITGDPLAVLAFTEFQLIDTRPDVAHTAPIVTRLATLAHDEGTTAYEMALMLRTGAEDGELHWDASANLATVTPAWNVVLIDGVLRIYPYLYVDMARCVARTSSGKRCRNSLGHGQVSYWTVWQLPDAGQYMQGFDLDSSDVFVRQDASAAALRQRYLAQRCFLHKDKGQSIVEPEWEVFDLAVHRDRIRFLDPDPQRLEGARIVPLPVPQPT